MGLDALDVRFYALLANSFSNIEVVGRETILFQPLTLPIFSNTILFTGALQKQLEAKEKEFVIEGKTVHVLAEKDPTQLPWKETVCGTM